MKNSKLFISYPSESWNFAQRIAEHLAPHIEQTIFIDYRSIDRVDFAESIVRNLRECSAVLLIVSEFTFADIHRDNDWLRIEIRTALENEIPIVLVREEGLLPPKDVPDDIIRVTHSQGIPFYHEFFDPGIDMLAEFLVRIGVATQRISGQTSQVIHLTPQNHTDHPSAPLEPPQRKISGQASITESATLLEGGDFEKALMILTTLKESGSAGSTLSGILEELLNEARKMQAQAESRREAELDYEALRYLMRRKQNEATARRAFVEWCEKYPDLVDELDTDNLKKNLGKFIFSKIPKLFPAPFEWVEIAGGNGWLTTYESSVILSIPIENYAIAKYPITNAQFRLFIDAGGYTRQKWWTDAGWKLKESEKWVAPYYWQDGRLNGEEQPVVGVSWYEAIAFCLWLSDATDESISLATEAQWQYAALGNDGRIYPWGNDWDATRCNHDVSGKSIGKTTSVRQYGNVGASPFGVMDMAGNAREWISTSYKGGNNDIHANVTLRGLRGGAWNTVDSAELRCDDRHVSVPHERAASCGFRIAFS